MSWRSHLYAAIPHPDRPSVLFLRSNDRWQLAGVQVDDEIWVGDVDRIVPAFQKRLGGTSWIYRQIHFAADEEQHQIETVYESKMVTPGWRIPRNGRWVDREQLVTLRLKDDRFRPILDRYLHGLELNEIPEQRPPWSQPNWLPEVRAWIEVELSGFGHRVIAIEQVKHWRAVGESRPDPYLNAAMFNN